MPSLPTLPKISWPYRATIALAVVALALSGALFFDLLELTLPGGVENSPWHLVLATGAAILAGTVLTLQFTGWTGWAWLGLGPAIFGAVELGSALAGKDCLLDGWLAQFALAVPANSQDAMPRVAALSLLLGGLAVAYLAVPWGRAKRSHGLALAGSLLAAVGGATLTAHAFTMTDATRWGSSASLPPGAALVIASLGAMLLLLAAREHMRGRGGPPAWLPLPFLVGSAALTFVFWSGLREREMQYLGVNAQIGVSNLGDAIELEFQRQSELMERLAQRWTADGVPEPAAREVDAVIQLADAPGARSLAWITPALQTNWYYPVKGNEALLGLAQGSDEVRKVALEAAAHAGGAVVSGTLDLRSAGPGFAIYAPVTRGGAIAGWVGMEYDYNRFLADLDIKVRASLHYRCSIYVGRDRVYESAPDTGATDESQALVRDLKIQQRWFRIELAPTREYLDRNRNDLPDLVLATGLGITLLLGLTVHLARAAGAGLRTTRDSNRRLVAENEERRVIEGRLKTSDERLNLALDSTAIGIFEWNVAAGEIHGNPGLWPLLGLAPNVQGNIPALWESQVHPADVAGFRANRAAQLGGAKDFSDAEYRMRTTGGGWRWVSVRSKTVAGAPTRIVGTLQDVTARKQAEAALGESQTAARKLSLVASKTDNLVIIAKPDGTIEWVNESFSRVMEYALDEVIGRNPLHFMVGPETSPRAIRRIRLALAHGQGVSTDIVNYAKSGRRYHLQLEIQPVRDASGVLENFIAIEADITARVEAETALRRAKAEADAASRAKSEFLASLSHEIRTPMNGVIGMTSLLLDTPLNPDQRDFVGTIRSSGEALLGIINDILDFSKIESGKFEIDHQPFELAACLEDALDLFTAQAAARQLELAHSVAADVPTVVIGDAARLRQVISNLVNNAIKFTPAGRVTVEARLLPTESRNPFRTGTPTGRARLQIVVRDTGIGIPPDRLNRLFKPFSQVDSSTTRKYGGTGLGLAICHRLCALMGGTIRVESQPGEGSAFIFTVAIDLLPALRQPVPPALPVRLPAGARVLCHEDNPVGPRSDSSHHPGGRPGRPAGTEPAGPRDPRPRPGLRPRRTPKPAGDRDGPGPRAHPVGCAGGSDPAPLRHVCQAVAHAPVHPRAPSALPARTRNTGGGGGPGSPARGGDSVGGAPRRGQPGEPESRGALSRAPGLPRGRGRQRPGGAGRVRREALRFCPDGHPDAGNGRLRDHPRNPPAPGSQARPADSRADGQRHAERPRPEQSGGHGRLHHQAGEITGNRRRHPPVLRPRCAVTGPLAIQEGPGSTVVQSALSAAISADRAGSWARFLISPGSCSKSKYSQGGAAGSAPHTSFRVGDRIPCQTRSH